ncbi:hypothetical protein POP12_124 [Pectobacterium phage POP12]|nr:hypothetical protein POP12_124 [Pectobacterium phage POP12]
MRVCAKLNCSWPHMYNNLNEYKLGLRENSFFSLSPDERERFIQMYREDAIKYQKDREIYEYGVLSEVPFEDPNLPDPSNFDETYDELLNGLMEDIFEVDRSKNKDKDKNMHDVKNERKLSKQKATDMFGGDISKVLFETGYMDNTMMADIQNILEVKEWNDIKPLTKYANISISNVYLSRWSSNSNIDNESDYVKVDMKNVNLRWIKSYDVSSVFVEILVENDVHKHNFMLKVRRFGDSENVLDIIKTTFQKNVYASNNIESFIHQCKVQVLGDRYDPKIQYTKIEPGFLPKSVDVNYSN